MIQEIHLFKQNDTRIFVKNTRAMITKLTLTVEKSVIDQAKIVAKASGRSLSKMVEEYLISLNRDSQITQENEDDLDGPDSLFEAASKYPTTSTSMIFDTRPSWKNTAK
jgi:hypothetical protein